MDLFKKVSGADVDDDGGGCSFGREKCRSTCTRIINDTKRDMKIKKTNNTTGEIDVENEMDFYLHIQCKHSVLTWIYMPY
jgi:hypothetical protein